MKKVLISLAVSFMFGGGLRSFVVFLVVLFYAVILEQIIKTLKR